MSLEEENAALRAENDALRRELSALREQVEHLTVALQAAQARIAELQAKKPPPPAFVKANAPPRPKRPRKKRAPEHNHARRLEPPTQVIVHQIDTCPQCHGRLSSRALARRRQIIEVPLPPPVQINEHQVFKGWSSYCRAWQEAPVDVSGQVVGQGRIGVGLASLIAHLRLVVRAPIRVIQAWLSRVSGVHLSVGELVDLLRRVAVLAQPALAQLRERARASPAVHADETGWREDGQNGSVWVLATAAGDRYFEYH